LATSAALAQRPKERGFGTIGARNCGYPQMKNISLNVEPDSGT
jgi:hypothetical protein